MKKLLFGTMFLAFVITTSTKLERLGKGRVLGKSKNLACQNHEVQQRQYEEHGIQMQHDSGQQMRF